jgi:aryl-alcohol dehydrogenase-like predicted oxidoreductase
MEFRRLGTDGPIVSRIAFGCFSMGGAGVWGWDGIDDNDSVAAVHRALEVGITFFDNAALYGLGHAEEILGKALDDRRKDVFVATKCGYWRETMWEPKSVRNSTPENIKRECEDSLRRLKTDYIDLFQIHWPDEAVPFDESMRAMLDLKDEGKVRYVGVSNYTVPQIEQSLKAGRVTSCQRKYNMLHREVEEDVLPFCRENGIGTMAYSALGSGILTGKYSEETTFGESDWRPNHNVDYQGERFMRILAAVADMKKLAQEYGRTMTQLATAWVLKSVDVAIIGMKNPAQVDGGAVEAADWEMSDEDMARIEKILAAI